MKRSSISIPSNIAEGFMRFHKKETVQFLFIALGSCAELRDPNYNCRKTSVYCKRRKRKFNK